MQGLKSVTSSPALAFYIYHRITGANIRGFCASATLGRSAAWAIQGFGGYDWLVRNYLKTMAWERIPEVKKAQILVLVYLKKHNCANQKQKNVAISKKQSYCIMFSGFPSTLHGYLVIIKSPLIRE